MHLHYQTLAAPFDSALHDAVVDVLAQYEEEHFHGRPITAHMLATGAVVHGRDPDVQFLRDEAANWLATLPAPGDERLRWQRDLLVDQAYNIWDAAATDPTLARLLLGAMLPHPANTTFFTWDSTPEQAKLID